jgi:hypothetical protein
MRLTKTLITLVFLLTAFSYGITHYWLKEKNERKRFENIAIEEVRANKEAYTKIVLKNKEIATLKPRLDSALKANNIKAKQVVKVIQYETKTVWDTIKFIEPKPLSDSSNLLIELTGVDDCMRTTGLLDLTFTQLAPTSNDVKNIRFSLLNTIVKDKGELVYYKKRDTTKLLRFWPFARMKYYSKGISDCGGQVKMQEIDFK